MSKLNYFLCITSNPLFKLFFTLFKITVLSHRSYHVIIFINLFLFPMDYQKLTNSSPWLTSRYITIAYSRYIVYPQFTDLRSSILFFHFALAST